MQRYLTIALIVALVPSAAPAAEIIPGPINARVVSVYDGDTMTVDAAPWPGLTARTSVRVAGVDTPEIRGKCQAEKDLAVRARDFVRATVGVEVQLTNVRLGKYAGRVIADVWTGGRKLSDILIAEDLGRPYDSAEAVKWYRKAAEQGFAKAQSHLGSLYSLGFLGVPQDIAEAAKWYRKAADQGNAGAQYNLGGMYVQGAGVPQDYVQAHMWLNLAASRFQACASRPPGKLLRCGEDRDLAVKNSDIVAKMMTPAQIAEAEKLAREWRPK